MTFADWVEETVRRFRLDPPRVAARSSVIAFTSGGRKRWYRLRRELSAKPNEGIPVYEHDWDVLIVLDACRPDALQAVADEYEWLPDEISTTHSVADMSRRWLEHNFVDEYREEMGRTTHVTWNAFSDFELDASDWADLDEVWRDVWDEELSAVPPSAMSTRAVEALEDDPERMLVHYMQPHAPYRSIRETDRLGHSEVGNVDNQRETIWDWLRGGKISQEEAWDAYVDNLRWVLDDLPRLLSELDEDQTVLLTADHGECFGEYGLYGHPEGTMVPELVEVPLAEVDTALVDDVSDTSEASSVSEPVSDNAEGRLEALGYI